MSTATPTQTKPKTKPKRRAITYDVTPMRNGEFRAECHNDDCGWYADHKVERSADQALSAHQKLHGGRGRRSKREP